MCVYSLLLEVVGLLTTLSVCILCNDRTVGLAISNSAIEINWAVFNHNSILSRGG